MTPPPAATETASTSSIASSGDGVRGLARTLPGRFMEQRGWGRLRLLLDIVVLYLATSAALFASTPGRIMHGERWLAAMFPILVIGILYARHSPDDRLTGSRLETLGNVIGIVSLSAMTTIAADAVLGGPHPVGLAVRLWVFSTVYLGIARVVLLSVRKQLVRHEAFATPTLIVGAGLVGTLLARRLEAEPSYGLRPVGFIDSDYRHAPVADGAASVPVLGGIDDLGVALDQTRARRLILAFSSDPDRVLVDKVRQCQKQGVEVSLVPRLYEAINEQSTLDHLGGVPLVSLRLTDPDGWKFAVKHAFDRAFAAVSLLFLAPLMIAIAIAVHLSSPGPVLFRQRRIGRDGRAFDLLKFRTMRIEPLDETFAPPGGCAPGGVEGQDRRTSVGRFLRNASLDELPQFLNVLRGEMSLVGPRPERPHFVERFSSEVDRYDDRHRVKCGITGWAQVHGLRGQTSIFDRVEWDNYYIRNWSLRLDFRIIAMTIGEVLRLRG
jgi:exopolysaccharide biosynthesis polyprenyl glycosylphosphotransferase